MKNASGSFTMINNELIHNYSLSKKSMLISDDNLN